MWRVADLAARSAAAPARSAPASCCAAAIADGATRVMVGVGGTASSDGGEGLRQALGAAAGRRHLVAALDVDNPLLGEHGAAAVYGPQKGATPVQVAELERRLAALALPTAERPGAGAGGGIGAMLMALGARALPGAGLVLDEVGFDGRLAGCDLCITAEGRIDGQTLRGKTVSAVAAPLPCGRRRLRGGGRRGRAGCRGRPGRAGRAHAPAGRPGGGRGGAGGRGVGSRGGRAPVRRRRAPVGQLHGHRSDGRAAGAAAARRPGHPRHHRPAGAASWRAGSPPTATRSGASSPPAPVRRTRSRRTWTMRWRCWTHSRSSGRGRSATPGEGIWRCTWRSRIRERLLGLVCVDPLGASASVFAPMGEALQRGLDRRPAPPHRRHRGPPPRRREQRGRCWSSGFRLMWPGYFADPAAAPPCPVTRVGVDCSIETNASIMAHFEAGTLERGLPAVAAAGAVRARAAKPATGLGLDRHGRADRGRRGGGGAGWRPLPLGRGAGLCGRGAGWVVSAWSGVSLNPHPVAAAGALRVRLKPDPGDYCRRCAGVGPAA